MKRKVYILLMTSAFTGCVTTPYSGSEQDSARQSCVDSYSIHQRDATAFGLLTSAQRSRADTWLAIKGSSRLGLSYVLLTIEEDGSTVFAYETLRGLAIVRMGRKKGKELYDRILEFKENLPYFEGASTYDSGTCDFLRIATQDGERDGFYLDLPGSILGGQESSPIHDIKKLAYDAYGGIEPEDVRPVFPYDYSPGEPSSIDTRLRSDVFFELSLQKQVEFLD